MDKDINLVIEDFKNGLTSTINNSGLPISVVYYIVTDLYKELDQQYYQYIRQARQEAAAASEVLVPAPEEMSEIEPNIEDN